MQRIDATAIETIGIPRLLLMDHAGLALARAAQTPLHGSSDSVLICSGTGFNGGDGLAAGRHLAGWDYAVRVILMGRVADLREEPAQFAKILRSLQVPILECETAVMPTTPRLGPRSWPGGSTGRWAEIDRWISNSGLIIDALLGIGARGVVREPMASLIARLNRSGKPIIAADMPSGLDGETGAVQGIAVHATTTVTFGAPKQGCAQPSARAYLGTLIVDPITIPQRLLEPIG